MSRGELDLHRRRWGWLEDAIENGEHVAPHELGRYIEANGFTRMSAAVGRRVADILKAEPKTSAKILRRRKGGTSKEAEIKRLALRWYTDHAEVAAGEAGPVQKGWLSVDDADVPCPTRDEIATWLSHDSEASQNDIEAWVEMLTRMTALKKELYYDDRHAENIDKPYLIARHYTVREINRVFGEDTINATVLKKWLPDRRSARRPRAARRETATGRGASQ